MKVPLSESLQPASTAERRQRFSDLFHALSQPLTTLTCSLELVLLRPHTEKQYREITGAALQQVERISSLSSAIRELLDAEDKGDELGPSS
jgi:signal transduction histidine kinase